MPDFNQIKLWIEPLGVVVTAIATIALAIVTWVLARETKRLAGIGQQPQVVLTIEPTDFAMHLLNYQIQNIGTAAAYEIEIEFSPALEFAKENRIPISPLDKISILKPTQGITSYLGSANSLLSKKFTVTISWKRKPSLEVREYLSYEINLEHLSNMTRLGHPPAEEISRHLKDIAKAVSGLNRLKVDVFNREDREVEQAEIDRQFAAFKQSDLSEYEP